MLNAYVEYYLKSRTHLSLGKDAPMSRPVASPSDGEIVWRIVATSAWPAIAAFAVFSFVAHWNDLYWPLIVISDAQLAPPPLGMMFFADAETGSNYGALTAAATILTAPLVIAFLFARLGLLNDYLGMIFVYVSVSIPFSIYLLVGYLEAVPRSLDEAAILDGCSLFQVLWRIVFPIMLPGVAASSRLRGTASR